jgi:mannose-1-phosphate guanylyltransferase
MWLDLRIDMEEHRNNIPAKAKINIVILAGGSGKRFWPLSTETLPKQFLPLLSKEPMIVETIKRLVKAPFEVRKVIILTNEKYKSWFKSHAFFQTPPFETEFIYEPLSKNTGPSLTWVAWQVLKSQSDASPLLVLSADHWISPTDVFQSQILELYDDCMQSKEPSIYTIGIPPTFPSTDYGYIECQDMSAPISGVTEFKEKPNIETAEKYLEEKKTLWNAGIFFVQPAHLISMISEYCPELRDVLPKQASARHMHEFFRKAPNLSIDHGLLERTPHKKCLKAKFKWSDIGTWPGLQSWQDTSGKPSPYKRVPFGGQNQGNIVFTDHSHPVVLLGCSDLFVINAGGKLLVAHKDHLDKLKEVIEKISS